MLRPGRMVIRHRRISDAYAHLGRQVHPDFVFRDFDIESGLAEFLGYVVRCFLVFGRAGDVGLSREDAQMLLGQLGIRHRKEAALNLLLDSEAAKASDCGCCGR